MASGTDEMRHMAQKVWGMLDRLAETSPEDYQRFVSQAMEEGKEHLDPPQPVLCLCTGVRGKEGCLLYINVCQWTRVPRPKTDSDPIPVKGGILRQVVADGRRRKGELLVDIAFNPYVLGECLKNEELKQMLISLSLDFVDDHLKIVTDRQLRKVSEKFRGSQKDIVYALDESWSDLLSEETRLDMGDSLLRSLRGEEGGGKRRDTSELPPLFPGHHGQRPHCRDKLIEDVSHSKKGREVRREDITTPKHSLVVKEEEGGRSVCVTVDLPGVGSAEEVELDMSETDLSLTVPGRHSLFLPLPLPVDSERTRAKYNKRTHSLTISLPCSQS